MGSSALCVFILSITALHASKWELFPFQAQTFNQMIIGTVPEDGEEPRYRRITPGDDVYISKSVPIVHPNGQESSSSTSLKAKEKPKERKVGIASGAHKKKTKYFYQHGNKDQSARIRKNEGLQHGKTHKHNEDDTWKEDPTVAKTAAQRNKKYQRNGLKLMNGDDWEEVKDWHYYKYKGTHYDDKMFKMKLKYGTNADKAWRYMDYETFTELLNAGLLQIRLQDGVNKINAEDPAFDDPEKGVNPQHSYWVNVDTKDFSLDWTKTKPMKNPKKVSKDDLKKLEWKQLKPPKMTFDPKTGKIFSESSEEEEEENEKEKEKEQNNGKKEGDEARAEYDNGLDEEYDQLLDELIEVKMKKAYTKGYLKGYRLARSMKKTKKNM